jgi:hypothetical protein
MVMADTVSEVGMSGSISPRNIDTVEYLVKSDIDKIGMRSGDRFRWWPYGEAIGWIINRGPIVKNGDIAVWEKACLITRVGSPENETKPIASKATEREMEAA